MVMSRCSPCRDTDPISHKNVAQLKPHSRFSCCWRPKPSSLICLSTIFSPPQLSVEEEHWRKGKAHVKKAKQGNGNTTSSHYRDKTVEEPVILRGVWGKKKNPSEANHHKIKAFKMPHQMSNSLSDSLGITLLSWSSRSFSLVWCSRKTLSHEPYRRSTPPK